VVHTFDLPLGNRTPDSAVNDISLHEKRVVVTKAEGILTSTSSYQCFRQFNKAPIKSLASSHYSINPLLAERYFPSDSLQDKLVRELGRQHVLPVKEILESFEFFQRVRKHVRAPSVTDLCCGHGLTGILFALFERSVERVTLIDQRELPSYTQVLASAVRVGSWVADKVHFKTLKMRKAVDHLEPFTSIIATHACGSLTDRCIDGALQARGAIALMPCCYANRQCTAPAAIHLALGPELAFDIDRTYRLQAAGYRVRWDSIPQEITPMNRILIGNIHTARMHLAQQHHGS